MNCYNSKVLSDAGLAHLVERDLAKVEVASSSLVTRSTKSFLLIQKGFFYALFAVFSLTLKKYYIFSIKIVQKQNKFGIIKFTLIEEVKEPWHIIL